MAKRPTLTDVTSGFGTAAVINANNAAIETAFDNTLSRDGSTPNQMEADLDMNSNRVLNLPYAASATEPMTLGQYNAIADPGPEYISVKIYGAKGDGSTDDTEAIQGALNAAGIAGGGTVYFPAGVYKITETLFVTYDNVTIVGDSQGGTIITCDNGFTGTGESIPETMIQINRHPSTVKIQRFTMRDIFISATHLTGLGNNTVIKCLFHANWVHYMNIERVTFYGANNGVDGIGALVTAVGPALAPQFSMLNNFTDCEFTFNRDGIWWGVAGQGDINAGQVLNCRIGGIGTGVGRGIWVRSGSYGNNFVNNDIESQNIAFDMNGTVNYLRGNLAEGNSIDYTSAGKEGQLHGNELNTVSSTLDDSFIQPHGMAKYLMLDSTAPNLIVDPRFNTKLAESAFIGTTVSAKTGDELGRNVLTFVGNPSVTNKARFLINNKGQNLRGWYTFVVRAKADVAGASLFVRLPGAPDAVKFSEIKSGTTLTLELLEANSHKFVASVNRSSALTTDYKVYFGSVYYNDQAAGEGELRLSAQGDGLNYTIDYFGMFEGRNAYLPDDNLVYERYTDVSGLASGGNALITQLPFPDQAYMKVTSVLNGAFNRSINEMNLGVANGTASSRVYHYDLNSFGYDATGSDVTDDHIYIANNSQLQYFSRSASLAGTENLYTKIEFF